MSCLHPIHILQKDGHYIDVPCGKCYGCLNKRALNYTDLCKIESSKYKYCMFVTLTYSNEYLPTIHVEPNVQTGEIVFRSLTDRVNKYYGYDILDCERSFTKSTLCLIHIIRFEN